MFQERVSGALVSVISKEEEPEFERDQMLI
jgi:hypothetical protein